MAPPYGFGKGPIAAALEVYLSDPANAQEMLDDIDRAAAPEDLAFAKRLKDKSNGVAYTHLVEETLGPGRAQDLANVTADQQRRLEDKANRRAGVFARGIKAAIERAYGVAPGDAIPAGSTPLPIEILWGCGRAEPQVWLDWRIDPNDRTCGQVTVVLLSDVPETIVPPEFKPARPRADATRGLFVYRDDGEGPQVFRPPPDQAIPPAATAAKLAGPALH